MDGTKRKRLHKKASLGTFHTIKTKEKISHFPKMYYRYEKGMIHIQVEITLGKYQEPLLTLEKKLESGLYCELVSKELHDSYVEYVLFRSEERRVGKECRSQSAS